MLGLGEELGLIEADGLSVAEGDALPLLDGLTEAEGDEESAAATAQATIDPAVPWKAAPVTVGDQAPELE